MASFDHLWNRNGNGRHYDNGIGPHHTPRLAAPALPPRDPEQLDPFTSSSAADWNGSAPRPHSAPGDELAADLRARRASPSNGNGHHRHGTPSEPDGRPTRNGHPLPQYYPSDAADRDLERRLGSYTGSEGAPSSGEMPAAAPDQGVHGITRNTDYWFERELHAIERSAREQAADWAAKGLPRHDLPRTEPLEPEQVLAAHSTQLFKDWHRRVRTRMQDAIEEGSQAVGRHVATLRNALTRLAAIRSERGELDARLERLRVEAEQEAGKPVRFDRYINGWLFWPGAIILATVEFFANFPVFRLMLPMSRSLATAAQAAAESFDDTSWLAGPQMLLREMLMHFEATVVALVAVVALVLLGKTLGGALRPLMAFREREHPLAAQSIRAHRRQQWLLAGVTAAGIVFVLGFLYQSRGSIATLAAERVETQKAHIATLVADAAALTDRTQIAQAAGRIYAAEQTRNLLEDDAAYARTVQQNNQPILFLNIAIILTALVLGYSYKSEDLSDKRGEHPGIVAARERIAQLDREMFAVLGEGRAAESQAYAGIGRVHHLLRASPLREWRSKLERLEGVIPLFRGENARLRGLDPANIRAFDTPATLAVPSVDDDEAFLEPLEFARLKEEFHALGTEFGRIAPRMTPAFGHPVPADS